MACNKLVGPLQKKHCLFAGILACLCILTAFTQIEANKGVVLTGTVLSVEPHSYSCGEKEKYCDYEITLYLQIKNETSVPVIILDPRGRGDFYGQKKISFLSSISKAATESTSTTIRWKDSTPHRPGEYYRDPVSDFVRVLLTPNPSSPPPFYSVIIPPEGYYEFREFLIISTGYKLRKDPDPKRKGQNILSAIPEYPALRIEYFLSVRNRPEDTNALEKAKVNWKEFGNLLLDSSGDYRVSSEIILNKLL